MCALLILLVACGQEDHKNSNEEEKVSNAIEHPVGELSGGSSESSQEEKVLKELFGETRALGLAWGEALNQHDFEGLSEFYAETVYFFGDTLDRASLIQQKQEKIADFPTFSQKTFYWRAECPTALTPPEEIKVKMGLREYWPPDSAFMNVDLVFRNTPEGWKIVSESDITILYRQYQYPLTMTFPEGSYCLKWEVAYDAGREEDEPRIGHREMEVEFTLEGRKAVDGWVRVADEYLEIDEKWKILGGQYDRWRCMEMELQPWDGTPEEGTEPPILSIQTLDGIEFLSGSPTVGFLIPIELLEKISCE